MLVRLLELGWVLRLVPRLLLQALDLDVGRTVGRRPPHGAVGAVLRLAVVLAEIAAGGDAAARGQEGGAVVAELRAARPVGVLPLDEDGLRRLQVDLILSFRSELLAWLVVLPVVAVEQLDVLDEFLADSQLVLLQVVHVLHLQSEQPVLYAFIARKVLLHRQTNSSSSLALVLNLDSVTSMILESMQFLIILKSKL
jgi:hypothetical protein